MGIDFRHTIEIDRPGDEVFRYIAEFENNPQWQGGMRSCRWTTGTRGVVGSTYVQEARFLGRRIETHFEVVAVDPGRSIAIESTAGTFPIQVTRSVEPTSDRSCRVVAHIRGQPAGLLSLFGGMVRKSVAKDYAKLKSLLEG